MVIRVLTGKSVAETIRYSEKKIEEGKASLLGVLAYPDPQMALCHYRDRQQTLMLLAALRPDVRRPVLHVSISLHPAETLDRDGWLRIANDFMRDIGYGRQPCLVYEHSDTLHPHIHLVSVSITSRGERISDSFLRYRVNRIRRELEHRYGLRKAEGHKPTGVAHPRTTTATLTGLLAWLCRAYRPCSWADWESLLARHRIQLWRRQGRGGEWHLGYQLTDGKNALTPVVRAARLAGIPARAELERWFLRNQQERARETELQPASSTTPSPPERISRRIPVSIRRPGRRRPN